MKLHATDAAVRLLPILLLAALAGCGRTSAPVAGNGTTAGTIALADPGPAVATVNGEAIPERLLQAFARLRNWDLARPELRERAIKELANYVATAQAARSAKLAPDVDLPALAEVGRLQAISTATVTAFQQGSEIDDAALRAEYEKQIARVSGTDYDFTQIVFRDEAGAAKAIGELAAGKSFDKVQEAHKKEALQSRSMTHVRSAQLPPPLAQALAAMKPGDSTKTPIRTPLGWHVVRLDAATPREPPSFDKVKEGLRRTMARRAGEERLSKIRAEARIEILPAPGAPPPATDEKKPEPAKPQG